MTNAIFETHVDKARGSAFVPAADVLAVEEPLEIQLVYGSVGDRRVKTVAMTMRAPGFDLELAVGFLLTEGIIHDHVDVEHFRNVEEGTIGSGEGSEDPFRILRHQTSRNVVQIQLAPRVPVALSHISRNFYTTSSCGVCGKSSLMALQTVCPASAPNRLLITVETLYGLPVRLRQARCPTRSRQGAGTLK